MIRKAHLQLVAAHSVRHGVRGGAGLISIFMTLVTGLVLATCVTEPLEMMEREQAAFTKQLNDKTQHLDPEMKAELIKQQGEMEKQVNDQVIKIARKVIDWTVIDAKADEAEAAQKLDYLTKDHPAMVTAFLVMLMLFTPFLTCLGGFNQTSSDIDSKGLRFLLIRTERSNIFLGRLIGTYIFSALVFLLLFLILGLYLAIKVKVHPTGDMIGWMLQGYLRVMLFSMPYMAVCAWISCAIESSFGSLMIALLCVYIYPGLIAFGSKVNEYVTYGQYLTPWGYKWWLFEPIGPKFFGGVAIMIGFTALFTWLGKRYFGKRDL